MEMHLNDILIYIENNIRTDLKLNDIADEFYYSSTYLSRQFNKYVGMSFNDYINRRRLSLIAADIRATKKSISYLADVYGYKSQKYFSTKFKEVFHITPSVYKKGLTFIVLQSIRNIKGDNKFMINDMKQLCFQIWGHSTDENTLLDTVAEIENAVLYKKENSEVTLIAHFNEGEYTNIYEVKLNLINGLYKKKSIFYVENKLHKILEISKEETKHYVMFEDNASKKVLRAYFEIGTQPYVIFQTNTVEGFKVVEENEDEFDISKVYKYIDELKKKILNQTNELEIKQLCTSEDNLVLVRHFGGEYVFVKLILEGRRFMMVSIYADILNKQAYSYHFFSNVAESDKVRIEKEGILIQTYIEDKLYATSHILGGDEIVSDIYLKFPSGMSGSGGWDFSSEFN